MNVTMTPNYANFLRVERMTVVAVAVVSPEVVILEEETFYPRVIDVSLTGPEDFSVVFFVDDLIGLNVEEPVA